MVRKAIDTVDLDVSARCQARAIEHFRSKWNDIVTVIKNHADFEIVLCDGCRFPARCLLRPDPDHDSERRRPSPPTNTLLDKLGVKKNFERVLP